MEFACYSNSVHSSCPESESQLKPGLKDLMRGYDGFYFRKSFLKCEILTVATACLFLAGKIEENPRKLKDVISVFDYVNKMKKLNYQRPIPVLDLNSFVFTDLKTEIIDAERFILKELGFSTDKISQLNAHKYIYFYLKLLKGSKQLA